MNEPYPGGPSGGYQPYPGGRRQPSQPDEADHWLNDGWFRPQYDQERGPGPREVPGERGRGGRHRQGRRGRPELDQTGADRTGADQTGADQTAIPDPQLRTAARNWALVAGMVFFLVDTSVMADGFTRPVAMASRVLVILIWLISLAVVALLWLRGSPNFSVQHPFRSGIRAHQR